MPAQGFHSGFYTHATLLHPSPHHHGLSVVAPSRLSDSSSIERTLVATALAAVG